MPCYINIEDRYNCRSLKARQQFNVFAATATALGASAVVAGAIGAGTTAAIGAGATLAASSMQSKAAGKAAAGQAAAMKKARRQEKKAAKGFQMGQAQIEADLGQIQMPVMDIGADIKDAERITGYNIAQLEQIYPGAKNQRQLASLAITDMLQGKLPQSVIGETMREAAQRGGAGFNIATAGKGAIAQAPQYDYARAIGASSLGLMQEGMNQSARWQQVAGQFIQGVLPVSQQRLAYGTTGAEIGLKKAGIRSDLLAAQYGAQLGQTQRGYERQLELEKTRLAQSQAGAEGLTGAGTGLTSGLTSALEAYNKYQTAKTSGIPQFSSLASVQQAAPYAGGYSQILGMGYVPRATAV